LRSFEQRQQQQQQTRTPKARFALTVSFFATHAWDGRPFPDQYVPMNASALRYGANLTIPMPKTATQLAWERLPYFFTERSEGRKRWRERYDGSAMYQETMKRLYRMATEVDDAVGGILDVLEHMGAANETMVVFTSDNGNFHGGAWDGLVGRVGGVCVAAWLSHQVSLTHIPCSKSPISLSWQSTASPTSGSRTRSRSGSRSSWSILACLSPRKERNGTNSR
jgi:arylsulfatase A-like enzyme